MELENKILSALLAYKIDEITLKEAKNDIETLLLSNDKSNKTVLVHYKEYIEPPHPMLNGKSIERSAIVEVKGFMDLNDMFKHIIKIDTLSE